jgi:hypothetical protein
MFSEKLLRPDEQITFIDQPMVKLIRGVSTICLTSLPDLFINLRARRLTIQIHLYRTLDIPAEFPALIINITVNRHRLALMASMERLKGNPAAGGSVPLSR